ncbi:MAG: polysaccharide deacetylase family protein [Mycolicibacterium neoaurum]|uniref:polysaccharide deacetylase family protein n=1 Tax=Mycolicibacterium neoaurum TaxID=1795 RepID=UPI002FFD2FAA
MRVICGVAAVLLAAATPQVAEAQTVDCAVVRCVALTFDDGPAAPTDRLLDVLTANGAAATFFLIGDKVAADPAAAARITAAGMEIGNHTWSHPDLTTIPTDQIAGQLGRATDAIVAATGQRPTLMRPGFGKVDDRVLAAAGAQGLAVVNWDVVPYDWIHDRDIAASRELLMRQVQPGSVVLLHDIFDSTVDLVEQFLPVLRANGYHVVTVGELLGPRAPGSLYGGVDNGPAVNALR